MRRAVIVAKICWLRKTMVLHACARRLSVTKWKKMRMLRVLGCFYQNGIWGRRVLSVIISLGVRIVQVRVNFAPFLGLGSLYEKIGLSCSVFVCAAVVEFYFGVVESGMTGCEPSLGSICYKMS